LPAVDELVFRGHAADSLAPRNQTPYHGGVPREGGGAVRDEASEAARRKPPAIPAEPDRTAPLLFLSHANARKADTGTSPAGASDPFSTFFNDLSRNVGQLVYRPPGADPGFIDRQMRTGVEWEQEILRAVGTCQVFVALISDPYVHRPWCGREWHAYAQRQTWSRVDRRPVETKGLLPVVWAPSPEESKPKIITARQLFVPRGLQDTLIGEQYLEEGIFGLLTVAPEAYRATVWRLAQEIQRLIFGYWVEPRIPGGIEALQNVFDEGES
jgi:hypothetical protein